MSASPDAWWLQPATDLLCLFIYAIIWVAGKKAKDMRNWLTIYSYWNQGGQENVATMLLYLIDQYLMPTGKPPKAVQETPGIGEHLPLSPSLHFSYLLLWISLPSS